MVVQCFWLIKNCSEMIWISLFITLLLLPHNTQSNDVSWYFESRKFETRWHDDVIKWEHFPRNWPFVRAPVNSPHKGQWRGASMLSLICTWLVLWFSLQLQCYHAISHITKFSLNRCGFCSRVQVISFRLSVRNVFIMGIFMSRANGLTSWYRNRFHVTGQWCGNLKFTFILVWWNCWGAINSPGYKTFELIDAIWRHRSWST